MNTIVDIIQLINAQAAEIQRLMQIVEAQRKHIEQLEQQVKKDGP